MLTIGYSGSLACYNPHKPPHRAKQFLLDWFWEYRIRNIDWATRSGYFLFKALKQLRERHARLEDELCLMFWGAIHSGNLIQAKSLGVDDLLHTEGFIEKEESLERLQFCDVLYLPLEGSLNGQEPLFIPGKLFEYLQLGKPILALAEEDSNCGTILRRSGLGVLCSPYDTAGVADALSYLLDVQGRLSEAFVPNWNYINQFNFEHIAGRMATAFRDALSTS